MARSGNRAADLIAQLGLGVIAGVWALPSSSGLVAILALVVGVWSAVRSAHSRLFAAVALIGGLAIGFGVLALSFAR